jgi:trans-aconitate methyltransferase
MSEYYRPTTSTSRREELKNLCMGGDAGVAWAEHYATVSFPSPETANVPMFQVLEESLLQGDAKVVHQVACSSGREVAHFARLYPEVKFIGSDMDDAVVAACRDRWVDIPNLSFTSVPLNRLSAADQISMQSDIVYTSGGLQYLDEPSLRRFLDIVQQSANRVLIQETLDPEFMMDENTHSTRRGNFTWNHPFTHYLADSGWTNIEYGFSGPAENASAKNVSVWARAK